MAEGEIITTKFKYPVYRHVEGEDDITEDEIVGAKATQTLFNKLIHFPTEAIRYNYKERYDTKTDPLNPHWVVAENSFPLRTQSGEQVSTLRYTLHGTTPGSGIPRLSVTKYPIGDNLYYTTIRIIVTNVTNWWDSTTNKYYQVAILFYNNTLPFPISSDESNYIIPGIQKCNTRNSDYMVGCAYLTKSNAATELKVRCNLVPSVPLENSEDAIVASNNGLEFSGSYIGTTEAIPLELAPDNKYIPVMFDDRYTI